MAIVTVEIDLAKNVSACDFAVRLRGIGVNAGLIGNVVGVGFSWVQSKKTSLSMSALCLMAAAALTKS